MTYIPEKLRRIIFEQANARCEYCLLHQDFAFHKHEIDHIYAEKHGGLTESTNLCLACADCNRHKGSNLCSLDPDTGKIEALFHPRNASWKEHFEMREDGFIVSLTARARVTARVLQFNRFELLLDRQRLIQLGKYDL